MVDGAVIPRELIEMVAQGSAAGVAVMVGSNLEEWKLFSAMDPSAQRLDKAGLAKQRKLAADHDWVGSYGRSKELRSNPLVRRGRQQRQDMHRSGKS